MAYLNSYKNQNWLLPASIKDMIPKEHICFFVEEFVEEFVESLDFTNFDLIYAGAGHPADHSRILMKTIIIVSIAHNLQKIWRIRGMTESY